MRFNSSLELDLMTHLGNKETDKYVYEGGEGGLKSLKSTLVVCLSTVTGETEEEASAEKHLGLKPAD